MGNDGARVRGFAAAAVLAASAVVQTIAAAQRWMPATVVVEDHLYDYVLPVDPWVSLGGAALLFGIGYLLIAAALVLLGLGARSHPGWGTVIAGSIAAAAFAYLGLHAAISGVFGAPSPLQSWLATAGALVLGVVQALAVVVFALVLVRRSAAWAVGVLTLLGATLPGYLVATFVIAPAIVGYQSHDTTPWTEGVLAVFTAAAAVLVGVGAAAMRRAAVRSTPVATAAASC